MEIIERYIYAVTQRLPEKMRADIKQELHGLILDMLEERESPGQASKENVESVLLELGHPNTLAAKYRGYERYLISPFLFDSYLTILKVVMFSIAIGMTVVFAIDTITSPNEILEHFIDYFANLIIAGAQGFGWVTIVFAMIDYRQQKDTLSSGDKNLKWKPSDLPHIPDVNKQIKMSEPITGIIFTVLFTVICLYSIELVGVWRFDGGDRTVIPFLNADVFQNYLPFVWILAALGILNQSVRIIVRQRTAKLLVFHIVISVVTTVLLCVMLADPAILNPDFIQQLQAAGVMSDIGKDYDTVISIWNGISDWLIIIIVFFALIDIISETYKWYRTKTTV
ncbi:hypothetical protein [Cohnella sp. WQ 127256]|uniref:hypothetical protein n=1 Tax=Cohnella sp. WQ 127256 TaxID=2938790 RepID=UPI002118ABDE|nr:hypothetical protein [Cohnella sp. WQ 127256]